MWHHNFFHSCLFAMHIYNNVLHTYPHNPWKFHRLWASTFIVMWFGVQQHFARPSLQHFLQITSVLTVVVYSRRTCILVVFFLKKISTYGLYTCATFLQIWSKCNENLKFYAIRAKYGIVRATKLYPIQQALESIIILLKLVFLQLKFIWIFLWYWCVFSENLNSIHHELSEVLFY